MKLSSPAFQSGQEIPRKYSADGGNVSPPLQWEDVPEGTQGYALIMQDPDAPRGTFTHWLVYDMPVNLTALPENASQRLPQAAKQGLNSIGKAGYMGPKPPSGERHRYFFKLLALSQNVQLPAKEDKQELLNEIQPYVIDSAELMGIYRS